MNIDIDLLSSPLFIIKKLQRNAFREEAPAFTGKVLDIGCGTRPYRRYIICDRYVAIDGSSAVNPHVSAAAGMLPFKDASFDTVICTEVIEHLDVPQECIAEIRRVLKDGGRLYITAPQSWPLHYEPYDYWRFTKYSLDKILVAQGLKIIKIKRIGGAFTLIGQEIVDVAWTLMTRALFFMAPVWAERLATLLCAPLTVTIYAYGMIADEIDKRYAFGWSVLAVK